VDIQSFAFIRELQPAFHPKAGLVDDAGRSSGLCLIRRTFPSRSLPEQWSGVGLDHPMALTATGIAPELHRTSLFVRNRIPAKKLLKFNFLPQYAEPASQQSYMKK
jgi:hypothetical protein